MEFESILKRFSRYNMRKILYKFESLKTFSGKGLNSFVPGTTHLKHVLVMFQLKNQKPCKLNVYKAFVQCIVIPLGFEPRTTTLKV